MTHEEQLARARVILEGPRGPVHLMGIAGVGMAGLAVQLAGHGFKVSGCDVSGNSMSKWIQEQGLRFTLGHEPTHITDGLLALIHTAAVDPQDPEIKAARAIGVPVLARGAVLPALLDGKVAVAVGGAHGKTTTTTMIAQVLRAAGIDTSYCIGAEVDILGGVARAGRDATIVVEADESDGTLALYAPDYAVITNIEMDHVDYFTSRESLMECFGTFAGNARKKVIYCADDPGALELLANHPKGLSYGLHKGASLRARHVELEPRSVRFEVVSNDWKTGWMELPIPGTHNVANALAACAVALELGIPFDVVRGSMAAFGPARRRFETVAQGGGVTVVSDYAHHPTEIRCLVRQARGLAPGRIVAVYQPHRYSRTRALGPEFPPAFAGIDRLILAPVYAASENPIEGGTSNDLFRLCERAGLQHVENAASLEEAWTNVKDDLRPGDLFLVIGAGDVEKIAAWAKDMLQTRLAPDKNVAE
jgi:UDP-N-acetylmuramate--alanine ligase